jgi:hypothetical protein
MDGDFIPRRMSCRRKASRDRRKEQEQHYHAPPVGEAVCKDCLKDFGKKELTNRRCPDCIIQFEDQIASEQARVEREQQAELAAGRAYYDANGHIVYRGES